jgi:hypothetical protein
VVLAILAFSAVIGRNDGNWNDAFRQVARRFHGVFYPGGWFHEPSVWIRHGQAQGRLTFWKIPSSGGKRCVQITLQQEESRWRCEIFDRQSGRSLAAAPQGLKEVKLEHDAFRGRWHVLASDPNEVRGLLSDGVRLAIDHLAWSQSGGDLMISLSPGWLVIRKAWHWPKTAELEDFVEHVCALSDQLNLAVAAGIEFVAGDRPQLLDDARCGVCGESLAGEIVVCRRCNTPHHSECWEYSGLCATYGCGCREYRRPGPAPLAERPLKPR